MANEVLVGKETVVINLRQTSEKAIRGVSSGLKEAAEFLADQVSSYMPFDTGTLESSLVVKPSNGGRDAGGRFARKSYSVELNSNKVNPKNKEKVGAYAWLMNEGLSPFGDGTYQLGAGSLSKAVTENAPVGGRFFERAEKDHADEILQIVAKHVRQALRDSISVGSSVTHNERRAWYYSHPTSTSKSKK